VDFKQTYEDYMIINDLVEKNLMSPPSFLPTNTVYLTIMGSHAYGTADVSDKTKPSDFDVYGFCIPPKEYIFPHLAGEILDFGRQKKRFAQWQEHHVYDPDALGGKGREYDFSIYSIVHYFNLVMENNPNCLDSLFTPQECILHITEVGNMMRENRKLFLHKGCWHKFKGYAYSQLNKMTCKNPKGKRKELRDAYGFDVKFGMHTVRLLSEVEMILAEGDLDLRRNNEQLKAIRRGDMGEEEIRRWAAEKEQQLEKIYAESKLPWGPDEEKIKALLLSCLEHHYGSLAKAIEVPDRYKTALYDIKEILKNNGIQ
jgi:predicted nucleotidyltransferase